MDWSTATERDNDYFTVERSADGSHFEEVFRQPGAGNSTGVLHYWGMDPWPLSGLSYYRLRQTDLDNTTTTSDVVSVRMARVTGEGLSLVQSGDALVAIHDLPVGSSVQVLDMTGRAVLVTAVDGEGRTSLSTRDLPHGAYVVRIADATRAESAPFVK